MVIGVISQSRDERRWSWRALRRDRVVDQALEDGNGVQITGLASASAEARASKGQLRRSRSIRGIPQEIEPKQWMIEKHSIGGSDHRLPASPWIPRDTNARLKIVPVRVDALLQPQLIVGS